jgi:hypothetical protein
MTYGMGNLLDSCIPIVVDLGTWKRKRKKRSAYTRQTCTFGSSQINAIYSNRPLSMKV